MNVAWCELKQCKLKLLSKKKKIEFKWRVYTPPQAKVKQARKIYRETTKIK